MFLSLALRVLVNVEAFNAVETVGNLTKHRRAPMVVADSGGYKLIYVPAVSGESVANAFQRNLVRAAELIYGREGVNPPITEWDRRLEFVKFMDKNHLTESLKKVLTAKGDVREKKHEFEKTAIKESIVADVGGFLYAEEELPVKRTSRLQTGYLLPTYDSVEAVAIEAQFHARHVPAETRAGGQEGQRKGQMIYYVEIASAVYGMTLNLDIEGVGRTSLVRVEDAVSADEKVRRIKSALLALSAMFTGEGFGAKLSRFLPVRTIESAVGVLSEPLAFVTSPPQRRDYIEDTVLRAKNTSEVLRKLGVEPEIKVLAYAKEVPEGAVKASSIEDLFRKLTEEVLKE
ncbi:MAG: type I-A CRISPR-associated protein Cas7/Csa2 [Desulfurococcales archaeon]|nr:type I-A CRISPR-associated protein Cas7/Csa2 [Desulfurococcales archaeon]